MKFGFDGPWFQGRCLKSVDDDENDGAWVYYQLTCKPSAQVS